ncbi:hypothetical protein [uncultured Novosphingobium sp.]|uniref:hypothetical protein n=1 Tax=uncultured Novosphingobium sp. TaxID=292277 RepID=UPI003748CC83
MASLNRGVSVGLFSFIGGLFGGGAQKKAANQAMQAQTAALNRAIDIGNQQFQQTRSDYMPYTQAGTAAIGDLSALLGLGGLSELGATQAGRDRQAEAIAQLPQGPLYQSLYRNGEEALLQNAAATGGIRGGNTQRGLADFGSDVLANVYQNQLSNLSGVAGLGLGATGSVASFGANNANNAAGLTTQIGQAQANNYLARGRINAQGWQNAGSFLDSAISAGLPGAGGGGFSLSKALGSIF